MSKISADGKTIVRFSGGSRLAHGIQAITFVLLFITGCAIAFRGFGNLVGHDMLKGFVKFHRALGLIYPLSAVVLILFSGKNMMRWLKDTFSFGKKDFAFVMAFPKDFFTGHADIPPQGRYNGGEKVNSLIQIFGFFIMLITGVIMYKNTAAPATIGWATTIHSVCGLVLGAIIMAHAYLGLLHPGSRASLSGMISGRVPMDFAKSHHPLWVEEVQAEEKEEK